MVSISDQLHSSNRNVLAGASESSEVDWRIDKIAPLTTLSESNQSCNKTSTENLLVFNLVMSLEDKFLRISAFKFSQLVHFMFRSKIINNSPIVLFNSSV